MHYEVQHNTLTDGWINTWLYAEADGVMRLETFATADEAQAALDEYLRDLEEELQAGNIDPYDRHAFRVQYVADAATPERANATGGAP